MLPAGGSGGGKEVQYWRNNTLYERYADFVSGDDRFRNRTCHQDFVVDIPLFRKLLREQVLINNSKACA